jgi:hypothetical protein
MATRPDTTERTSAQIRFSAISYDNILPKSIFGENTYEKSRKLRKDPTIALGRNVIEAIVASGAWAIECSEDVPDDVVKFIQKQFLPMRSKVVETSTFYGYVDYGWQGYEKVFKEQDGKIILSKLKPLLHDITDILISKETGAFAGYRQKSIDGDINLPLEKCLHIAFRVEGTQLHGESLLDNVSETQRQWQDANAGASRYDKKIAGSHFVVYYPPGTSLIGGESKDNGDIAAYLLMTLESSGSIAIPKTASQYIDDLNKQSQADSLAWQVEILEDKGGRQPTFIDRLKYLDSQKLRGIGVPERAIIEGSFGTKAEAGVHGDLLILIAQSIDRHIVRALNEQCLNHIIALNYGEAMKGKIRLVSAPIADEAIGFLRELYKIYLGNANGFLQEYENIDTDNLKDRLGVPKSKQVAMAGASNAE